MVSAGRIQTLLTCAKAPESYLTLPDGFSVGFTAGHETRYIVAFLFEGGVYFVQELRIMQLLFEGGDCSRAASIRRNTVGTRSPFGLKC